MARIGFDLDGVVYDFRQAHADFETGRGNTHCALELAADHWDYFDGWKMSLDEWLASYAEGVDAGRILWLGNALPGAVDASRELRAAGHTVHVVTDRSIGLDPQGATQSWLASVGFEYDTLDFSRDKTAVPTDYFIEDRYENAVALENAGVRSYLLNQPWNSDRPFGRRVDSLDEFVAAVRARESVLA